MQGMQKGRPVPDVSTEGCTQGIPENLLLQAIHRREQQSERTMEKTRVVKNEADTMSEKYKIVRFYYPALNRRPRTINTGLTLEQAQAHCSDPKTRKEGIYFDGYTAE